MTIRLQPFLHDLTTILAAPTQVLSTASGDVVSSPDAYGAQGILHADVRVLSDIVVTVGGHRPEHVRTTRTSRGARFTSLLRRVRTDLITHPDPTLRLDRTRSVAPNTVVERFMINSALDVEINTELSVLLTSDLLPMEMIKSGEPAAPQPLPDSLDDHDRLSWSSKDLVIELTAAGATAQHGTDATQTMITWPITVPAHGSTEVFFTVLIKDVTGVLSPAEGPGLAVAELTAELLTKAGSGGRPVSPVLEGWIRESLTDLNTLRLTLTGSTDAPFFAAGSPWYLTLFGRDSLWAARLLLPVDTEHAVGTLRTLARLQGTTVDADMAQAPGKIMHELRRAEYTFTQASLPPLYYGTIDATPLWICLLHDTWRRGVDDQVIRDLLPNLKAALTWLVDYGDADGDGFLEYIDESGHGLANQGWKDSGDSVRFADGSQAVGPVALCEVQGYAYEAAIGGAAILDAFDEPGGDTYRQWAADLADRFRATFWVKRDGRPFPALALDGQKRQVDSTTSNIGHLLGTGLLSVDEERLVAERLAEPDMDSGLGLRTMSSNDGGYSPLSYHCGSVWPHDTAVVIAGMVKAGLTEQAQGLVQGLLTASTVFDRRFPELWSGEGVAGVPYPASCRPQAWSAAAVVPVVEAIAARRKGADKN